MVRLIAIEERDQSLFLTSKRKLFGTNLSFVDLYYDTDALEITSKTTFCHSYQSEGVTVIRYGSPTPLISLDLFDLNGRMVKSFNLAASYKGEVQAVHLPEGTYIASLRDNAGKVNTIKITVTR